MAGFLPLPTDRLVLRRFAADDAEALAAYRSMPDVARYQGWRAPYPVEDARRLIAEQTDLDGPAPGRWIQIAVTAEGEVIGDVAVGLDADGLVATIGYTLTPAHQGRGYAVEAVGAVVDRLLADGVWRIEASLDPDNVASARVIEALGFELEGVARQSVRTGEGWTDDARYGMTEAIRTAWTSRPDHRPVDVRLVEITPDNAPKVFKLATLPNQRRFVATMAESFADALVPEIVDGAPVVPWFRAVEADGELAGFVMLAEVTPAHPEPYLWRLLVDRRHQRRGIGDRVLALLVEHLRAEGRHALLTSWELGPGGPEPFYVARGFVPTGEVDGSEIVARLRF